MAKFTASVPLNIRLVSGEEIVGVAGTTHRISDAIVEEFIRDVVPLIPGGVTWIAQDETGGAVSHNTLINVTANQHHSQVHSISGSDHTGSLPHSSLSSITATDHHAAPA